MVGGWEEKCVVRYVHFTTNGTVGRRNSNIFGLLRGAETLSLIILVIRLLRSRGLLWSRGYVLKEY